MADFFIGFFSFALVLLCLFIILLILMQKPSSNASLGASLGGRLTESTLGGESSQILNRWTMYASILFFVGAFTLSLGKMANKPKIKKMPLIVETVPSPITPSHSN